ncbi:MAG: hypothetical protein Kow0069_03310 [Promethearchaeota archaeon]
MVVFPRRVPIFGVFFRDFFTYLLLNTFAEREPEDRFLDYYSLCQEFSELPRTRVYREIKALEASGLLVRKDESTGKRPKHAFKLSEKGVEELAALKVKLAKMLKKIQELVSVVPKTDVRKFLDDLTFTTAFDPVRVVLNRVADLDAKVSLLRELEKDLREMSLRAGRAAAELERSISKG